MSKPTFSATIATGVIQETLRGVVDRVTFHNADTGWSVLRVFPFDSMHQQETVVVHQTRVFAGATMEFQGAWTMHPKHGRQFKATHAIERKPATAAALQKYIGSGLIKGVGPKTAQKIVAYFGDQTLPVFEEHIDRLTEVAGIAEKKLAMIQTAWQTHRAVRDVMMFLQSHGISTLFAVRIYKLYGDEAVARVRRDPYQLANDFYGIGFFSADKVALSIGFAKDSAQRIMAAIKHVLAASRDFGHCYLTQAQIAKQVQDLLDLDLTARLPAFLSQMDDAGDLKTRLIADTESGVTECCYYSRSLYYDEWYTARKLAQMRHACVVDDKRVSNWIARYCRHIDLQLSREQSAAVAGIAACPCAILTGGPGCGKTTTTRVVVKLLEAMGRRVILAAPTGRAAQRMAEVIGREAKTIHRLLQWQAGKFKRNEENPLDTDFLVVDECSMLDINLMASLLKAVPDGCQVLLIGDPDQLPAVGAGNVLRDLIASQCIACFHLKEVFRQARESRIIRFAHQINQGKVPHIESPFHQPAVWQKNVDCLFIDSDEATQAQLNFIRRVKAHFKNSDVAAPACEADDGYEFRIHEDVAPYESEFQIPKKFANADMNRLLNAQTKSQELMAVMDKVHPWSSLHYGLSATGILQRLYLESIPRYCGADSEIQILSPMTRGSLGTVNLNRLIQATANPARPGTPELKVGERIFRQGDRVIHRRNNYDLGVFNGDIGHIVQIDNETLTCVVRFMPDGRDVMYQREDISELDLAYAITIHKSQGSEFETVLIPVTTQHFKMLYRNLIYTGLTRARKMAVLVGARRALAMAVRNRDTSQRQTYLKQLLTEFTMGHRSD